MAKRANFAPERFRAITPSVTVKNATEALAFYKKAFGATELSTRLTEPRSGKIAYAEIAFGDSVVIHGDEFPNGATSVPSLSTVPRCASISTWQTSMR